MYTGFIVLENPNYSVTVSGHHLNLNTNFFTNKHVNYNQKRMKAKMRLILWLALEYRREPAQGTALDNSCERDYIEHIVTSKNCVYRDSNSDCFSRVRRSAGLSIPGRDTDCMSCSVFIFALRSLYSALKSIPLHCLLYESNVLIASYRLMTKFFL